MENNREEKKETQPKSEALERINATQDQILISDILDHKRSMNVLREQREQQLIEHNDQLFKHYMENNRKTLSFLYDVEIPEATANAIIVKAAKLITANNTNGGD